MGLKIHLNQETEKGEKFHIGVINKSKQIQKSLITIDKNTQILQISVNKKYEIKIKFQDIIYFEAIENLEYLNSIKISEEENCNKKIPKIFNLNYFPLINQRECSFSGMFCCSPIKDFSTR